MKSAVTDLAALMVTVHVARLTVSQPLHPVNSESSAGDAVNVTVVPKPGNFFQTANMRSGVTECRSVISVKGSLPGRAEISRRLRVDYHHCPFVPGPALGWPAQPEVGVATCQTPILDSCSHSGQTRQSTTV